MSFVLLSICTDLLAFDNERVPHISNKVSFREYKYLPGPAILVNFTEANEDFPNVKPLSVKNAHSFTSKTMYSFIILLWLKTD